MLIDAHGVELAFHQHHIARNALLDRTTLVAEQGPCGRELLGFQARRDHQTWMFFHTATPSFLMRRLARTLSTSRWRRAAIVALLPQFDVDALPILANAPCHQVEGEGRETHRAAFDRIRPRDLRTPAATHSGKATIPGIWYASLNVPMRSRNACRHSMMRAARWLAGSIANRY